MKKEKTETKAINCEQAVLRFNDFMDNYLKGDAKKELMNHITECRHCFERFEFEQLLKSKVHQLSENSKDKNIIHRIEKMIASL